jgi:tripartite-type tricarboxylate transporter receptor subunit TctC
MTVRKAALLLAAFLAGYGSIVPIVEATEAFPSRTIRIVSPYVPGGPTDILSRLIGQHLQQSWGYPVIVENVPGAGGNVGAAQVAKAPADGYTLLMGAVGPLAVNAALYPNLPFHPLRDFEPVVLVATAPLVLVTHPQLGLSDLTAFLAHVKSKSGQISYGSPGIGTPQHVSMELLKAMSGAEMTHVPYRGSGALLNDLLGGHVQIAFEGMIPLLPHLKDSRLKPIAISTKKRSPTLPDLPTLAESGLPQFEASAWYGLVAPAGTPRHVIDRLNQEVRRILSQPEIRQQLAALGSDDVAGTPEAFSTHMNGEVAKWAKLVRDAKLKIE